MTLHDWCFSWLEIKKEFYESEIPKIRLKFRFQHSQVEERILKLILSFTPLFSILLAQNIIFTVPNPQLARPK